MYINNNNDCIVYCDFSTCFVVASTMSSINVGVHQLYVFVKSGHQLYNIVKSVHQLYSIVKSVHQLYSIVKSVH